MSNQSPPEPPSPSRGPGKGPAPAGGAGVNWRVLILMAIALGILVLAWTSSGFGKPERLTYTQFRDYVDSGKIIVDQSLPQKADGKFPDARFTLKKSGDDDHLNEKHKKSMPWITIFQV